MDFLSFDDIESGEEMHSMADGEGYDMDQMAAEQLNHNIKYLSNAEIDAKDEKAKASYAATLGRIKAPLRKYVPLLEELYDHPNEYRNPLVPQDLQIAEFLRQHPSIVLQRSIALPSLNINDHKINRTIWYWNLDKRHAFHHGFSQIRYNVLVMCIAWGSGFDTRCFDPQTKDFVTAFLLAWREALHGPKKDESDRFEAREAFLKIWQRSGFDLVLFSSREIKKMNGHYKRLMSVELDAQTEKIYKDPLQMMDYQCRLTHFTVAQWKEFGAVFAVRWLHANMRKGDEIEEEDEYEPDEDEMELEVEDTGSKMVMGDPESIHDLRHVDWNEEVLDYLVNADIPSDPGELPEEEKERMRARAWVHPDIVLSKILVKPKSIEQQMMELEGEMAEVELEEESMAVRSLNKLFTKTDI